MSIFISHPPADPRSLAEGRDKQSRAAGAGQHDALLDDLMSAKDQVCVATGKVLRDAPSVRCKTCKHSMIAAEMGGKRACPLCHGSVQPDGKASRGPKQARTIEASSLSSSSR
eukprot:GHUV01006225.1.p3 GENE.GHUV01006225.1~~GHUV01006225.1.p3  ORF type:complete len:113 (+),score=37.70 GHUV01006225.1:468-806(+)